MWVREWSAKTLRRAHGEVIQGCSNQAHLSTRPCLTMTSVVQLPRPSINCKGSTHRHTHTHAHTPLPACRQCPRSSRTWLDRMRWGAGSGRSAATRPVALWACRQICLYSEAGLRGECLPEIISRNSTSTRTTSHASWVYTKYSG